MACLASRARRGESTIPPPGGRICTPPRGTAKTKGTRTRIPPCTPGPTPASRPPAPAWPGAQGPVRPGQDPRRPGEAQQERQGAELRGVSATAGVADPSQRRGTPPAAPPARQPPGAGEGEAHVEQDEPAQRVIG